MRIGEHPSLWKDHLEDTQMEELFFYLNFI